MLSKARKIKREDFPRNFKDGKTYNSLNISLFVSKNKTKSLSRFSFVVSSKVSKKAIKRNKLKRRGYYIINKNKKIIKNNFYVVLFFKKGSVNLNFKEINNEIMFLLNKSMLIIDVCEK
jgi:ribonuclease P protein component